MADPTNPEWLGNLKDAIKEANAIAAADKTRRAAAAKVDGSVILSTNELASGKFDAHKILKTTLGGTPQRDITNADLAEFKRNIERVQKSYVKGITASQIVDLSLAIDRKRAKDEIHHAVVSSAINGKLRFTVKASGKYQDVRHFVNIEFNKELYDSLAAGGNTTPRQAALTLRKSRFKFECSCKRFTYFYRYVASIGGYVTGRVESGYPKIKNSGLRGISCKHGIRVASEIISSGFVLESITNMMQKAKSHEFNKSQVRAKQADVLKELEKQANRKTDKIDAQVSKAQAKRNKQELAKEVARLKAMAERTKAREAKQAAKLAAEKAKLPPTKKPKKPPTARQIEQAIDTIRRLGLSDEQTSAMIAALRQQNGR